MATSIGGLPIRNTRDVINADTRICAMVVAPPKFGKTTFGASLCKLSEKFLGKPGLIIAIEAGEGGGTMTLSDFNIDFVQPTSFNEVDAIISALSTDTKYGAVVFDSATDYVKRFLQPYALRLPNPKEKSALRDVGVPGRSDYQTMGEKARDHFNKLISLTTNPNLNIRKHLLVTALEREKTNDDGALISIHPDLPGQMAGAAVSMFQTIFSLQIKTKVQPDPSNPKATQRIKERLVFCEGDGVRVVGDRTKLFPNPGVPDFPTLWEQYWLPGLAKRQA